MLAVFEFQTVVRGPKSATLGRFDRDGLVGSVAGLGMVEVAATRIAIG